MNLGILFTVYTQIITNQPGINEYDAMHIATINTEMAAIYGIDPVLITAIQMQESTYRIEAKNNRDCGIMQVGPVNQKHHNVSCKRLRTDARVSIETGVKTLAWFKKVYKKRDGANWFCRYNVGVGKLKGVKKQKCLEYIERVQRWKRN